MNWGIASATVAGDFQRYWSSALKQMEAAGGSPEPAGHSMVPAVLFSTGSWSRRGSVVEYAIHNMYGVHLLAACRYYSKHSR